MLNQQQLDQFETQGFLVVENLIDQRSVSAVKREYEKLLDQLYAGWFAQGLVKHPPTGMTFWDKLEQAIKGGFEWYQPFDITLPHSGITEETPMHIGPAVFDIVTHNGILDVMEQLIGPEISSNPIQHVRIKPPAKALPQDEKRAHITKTDWHQDMGVTLEEADETKFITVWLAITDATIENGCLQVAPGRRQEMLPHCSKNQVGIADALVPRDQSLPVPVKAGGAVIFDPFTPHGSLDNISEEFRWSFDLRYHITGQPSGRSQFPDFIARSKSNPARELSDWQEWRGMWDATRTHLANSAHVAQHRWDNSSPYCA